MKRLKYKKSIIFFIVLFISIGFAYLSSSFNLNGLIGYKGNSWDIHFENIQIINDIANTESPILDENKVGVSFGVPFSEPGELYEFSIDVVNDGSIDAMLDEIIKSGITSTNSDYFDYNITYINGKSLSKKDLLAHGTKVRIDVVIKYKYETTIIAPSEIINFSLTLKYIQASDDATPVDTYYESGTSNVFTLNNVKSNTLSNLKIYGNTMQNQYSGQNLYNYLDYHSKTEGIVVGDDGWISLTYDNSQSETYKFFFFYTHDLNIVEGKTYTTITEIKNVSGTGQLRPCSHSNVANGGDDTGQLGDYKYNFSDLSSNSIKIRTTTAVATTPDNGIRTYILFNAGESGSITFRISVIEGNNINEDNFVYEPYTGGIPSPNLNYPQKIKSVTGNSNIEIINNISNFPYESGNYLTSGISVYGLSFEILNGYSSIISGNASQAEYRIGNRWNSFEKLFSIEPNTTYYFLNNLELKCQVTLVNSVDRTYRLVDVDSGSFFTSSSTEDGISSIRIYVDSNATYDNTLLTYYIYKDVNNIPLSLEDIKLNKIDDYRDYIYNRNGDWYIHREIGSLDLSSITSWWRSSTNYIERYASSEILSYVPYKKILCTHFIFSNSLDNTTRPGYFGFVGSSNLNLYFDFALYDTTTVDDFKNWCVENKPIMYYPLSNSIEEKITYPILISQLNAIIDNNLFDGVNIITVNSDGIIPDIEFDYVHN